MLFLSLSQEKALKYESCSKYSNKAVTLSSLTGCSHLIAMHLLLKKTFWQKIAAEHIFYNIFITMR